MRRAETRWLLIAMPAAILCFMAAHVISSVMSRQIDEYSSEIADNASPSIQHLSRVLAILRNMETFGSVSVGSKRIGLPVDTTAFSRDDDALHAELANYLTLPAFPGERALYQDADQTIDAFTRTVDRLLRMLEAGEIEPARDLARNEMHARAARADDAVTRLLDFNASKAAALSERILHLRRQAMYVAYGLNGLAALVALGLMLVTWRAARARGVLVEERQRIAEMRAHEMELFAGRVAHDLKNPLGSMALRIGLAKRHSGDENLAQLAQQVRAMGRLIDGLLEFALSGARPDKGAVADVDQVAREVLDSVADEAGAKSAELEMSMPSGLKVACHAGALASVLHNLVTNALKYIDAGSGPRKVTLRVLRRGTYARVEVEDTGPGIPAGQEGSVFEPWVRLASTSNHPGQGLGLATVKRIVEAYAGSVGVRSRPGEGAAFWVELPLADREREDAPPPPAERSMRGVRPEA